MRHFRLPRMVAIAAMLGSSFALAGGAIVAGPASAAGGGTNNCTTLTASGDISAFPPVVSGTLSGCHQQGGGTLSAIVDISGGVSPGSIFWNTGKATTLISLQVISIDFSAPDCPAGNVEVTLLVSAGNGPYEGSSATNVACADISAFPVVSLTNFGQFVV